MTTAAISRYQRRGSGYVAVLGASMIVTVIGVGALLATRIQRRAAEGTNDVTEARLYAQSAADLALFWISKDSFWRDRYAEDAWMPRVALGQGSFSFKLVDEVDGDLNNDPEQPVRLYAMGCVGEAVRIHSVLLEFDEDASAFNLLLNAGMENGTADWTGYYCDLESREDGPHDGVAYLKAKSRDASWAGPRQDLTASLTSDTSYYCEVWVRTKDFSEAIILSIYTNSTGTGTRLFDSYGTTAGTTWTKVTGTLTPSWYGTLTTAYFCVNTQSSKQDFYIDDAVLMEADDAGAAGRRIMTPVPGSWNRGMQGE